ncbi:MAG: hypothetical protein AAB388_00895 [Patescibacteria group bacterium]
MAPLYLEKQETAAKQKQGGGVYFSLRISAQTIGAVAAGEDHYDRNHQQRHDQVAAEIPWKFIKAVGSSILNKTIGNAQKHGNEAVHSTSSCCKKEPSRRLYTSMPAICQKFNEGD